MYDGIKKIVLILFDISNGIISCLGGISGVPAICRAYPLNVSQHIHEKLDLNKILVSFKLDSPSDEGYTLMRYYGLDSVFLYLVLLL